MIKFLIYWVVIGGVAGALGRKLMPGKDPMSIPATIGLGLLGALLGSVIAFFIPILEMDYKEPGLVTVIFCTLGALGVLALRNLKARGKAALPDQEPVNHDADFDPLGEEGDKVELKDDLDFKDS